MRGNEHSDGIQCLLRDYEDHIQQHKAYIFTAQLYLELLRTLRQGNGAWWQYQFFRQPNTLVNGTHGHLVCVWNITEITTLQIG